MQENRPTLLASAAGFAIRIYRNLLSPFMLHSCRFIPTCSEYALCAVERHGALRGFYRSILRLLRCHPLAQPGFDPVD